MIVDIKYLFGIGGIIIFCCVMWDFYKVYLCVFVEICLYIYLDEDISYVNKLVDCIGVFEEMCYIFLVILIDGK